MNVSVFVSTFLAASIEVIEMVAIIVAVGVTRQWRGALAGTLAGLFVLAVLIAALGASLQSVPLTLVRLVVGALLLVFGLQWLRKGVLRVSARRLGLLWLGAVYVATALVLVRVVSDWRGSARRPTPQRAAAGVSR
jgi:uncharacterized membrane protein